MSAFFRAARGASPAVIGGALALCTLGFAARVRATPSQLTFSWSAPASCPDRQMVLHQLEAVLDEQRGELHSAAVRGDIVRSGEQWVLSLDVQVGRARRVRRLSSESCDDLGKAAAVALGLLIRPLGENDEGRTASNPPASNPPASNPPASNREAPAALATPKPGDATVELDAAPPPENGAAPLAWQLGADAVVDSSTLAGLALGASVQTELRLADWGFGAYGLVLPAHRRDVAGGSVEFEQWALGLRACHALWTRAWHLDGCVGAELGRFAGRGSGLNRTRNEVRDPWLAPSAGLHVRWHVLPHAALLGRLEAVVPLLREKYVINGDDAVHETPPVTARASVGLEFDLL